VRNSSVRLKIQVSIMNSHSKFRSSTWRNSLILFIILTFNRHGPRHGSHLQRQAQHSGNPPMELYLLFAILRCSDEWNFFGVCHNSATRREQRPVHRARWIRRAFQRLELLLEISAAHAWRRAFHTLSRASPSRPDAVCHLFGHCECVEGDHGGNAPARIQFQSGEHFLRHRVQTLAIGRGQSYERRPV